jgi:putative nucleotidyltransferase with HDIG domain
LREWINKEGFISYAALPLHATGEFIGVLELYHRERFVPDKEWIEFAETLANDCAIGMQAVKTRVALQTANQQLLLAYETTLTGWAKALEYRDKETEGHSDRVTQVTVELAQRLNASEDDLTHIRWGARLHDIGKMAIPDRILLKEGPLDEDEWVKMRQHPKLAYNWLREIPFLKQALDIPHYHHEKWDGSGYPEGLSGNDIPIPARIFTIVDVWDALSHDRPYRKAWTKDQVRAYLQNQSGTHFDPEIVPEFLAWLDENEH